MRVRVCCSPVSVRPSVTRRYWIESSQCWMLDFHTKHVGVIPAARPWVREENAFVDHYRRAVHRCTVTDRDGSSSELLILDRWMCAVLMRTRRHFQNTQHTAASKHGQLNWLRCVVSGAATTLLPMLTDFQNSFTCKRSSKYVFVAYFNAAVCFTVLPSTAK